MWNREEPGRREPRLAMAESAGWCPLPGPEGSTYEFLSDPTNNHITAILSELFSALHLPVYRRKQYGAYLVVIQV